MKGYFLKFKTGTIENSRNYFVNAVCRCKMFMYLQSANVSFL